MNIYVGNFTSRVREAELHLLFEGQGLGKILVFTEANSESPRSRGYAIIAIDSDVQATKAIQLLNGKKLKGEPLVVKAIDNESWHTLQRGNRSRAFQMLAR